jgi:mannose-6-phosphate isomerase-like protein (cupin superfamily)
MKRVVTGVDDDGRSYVVSAEELSASDSFEIWNHEPAQIEKWLAVPEGVAASALEPVPGGLKWFHAVLPPGPVAGTEIPGIDEEGFHTTRTVDLIYLLSGELTLLLDRESVELKAGDVVVQQVTRHAWRNDSDAPAVLLAVLHRPQQ